MPHWLNLTAAETQTCGTTAGLASDSPEPDSHGCWLFQTFVLSNDTGNTVQAPDETFHLSIYADPYGNAASYNGDEQEKLQLLTSFDPDGVDADTGISDITVLDSVLFSVGGCRANFTADNVYTTVAEDVGRKVYLVLTFKNPAGGNVFPRFPMRAYSLKPDLP